MSAYTGFELKPLSGGIGAELRGIDLSKPVDDTLWGEIHDAFLRNLVLVMHDQALTPALQVALGRRFGEILDHPFRPSVPGFPGLLPIVKEPHETVNVGGVWHTDLTCLPEPPLGSLLYARQVPDRGGDTLFSNSYLAYEALSPGLQRCLEGLKAVHTAAHVHGVNAVKGQGEFREKAAQKPQATALTEQPIVRTHPQSGRKGLFVNRAFTVRIAGWSEAESAPLLEYLYTHMVRPEFVCRVQWRRDTLVVWDNRCTQHYALNDYQGQRREMHRLMIGGDRPV